MHNLFHQSIEHQYHIRHQKSRRWQNAASTGVITFNSSQMLISSNADTWLITTRKMTGLHPNMNREDGLLTRPTNAQHRICESELKSTDFLDKLSESTLNLQISILKILLSKLALGCKLPHSSRPFLYTLKSLNLCFHSPACCTEISNPLPSATSPLTSLLRPQNQCFSTFVRPRPGTFFFSQDEGLAPTDLLVSTFPIFLLISYIKRKY